MFKSALLFALLVGSAWAKKPIVEDGPGIPIEMQRVVEATNLGNLGEREMANKVFTEILANNPANIDARVGRGVNNYLLGNVGDAEADLNYAFSAEAWKDIQTTTDGINEVTQHVTTVDLLERRAVAAAMLIVLQARGDNLEAAAKTLALAQKTFKGSVQILAAQARLQLAQEDNEEAWKSISAAVNQVDTTLFVQSVASEMVAKDPNNATDVVVRYLDQMGQWTVHFNKAVGHYKAREYDECTKASAEGIRKYPDNPKMRQWGYNCAVNSDLSKADVWLDELGGPANVDPFMVVKHAEGLVNADRGPDAVKLLSQLPAPRRDADPKYVRSRQILHLRTLVELGWLDDAIKIADGRTAPEAETPLAYELMQKNRYRDAQKILEKSCPNLKDRPSDQQHCLQQLEWARTH